MTYDSTRPQALDAHLALELTIISCSSCMRQDSNLTGDKIFSTINNKGLV